MLKKANIIRVFRIINIGEGEFKRMLYVMYVLLLIYSLILWAISTILSIHGEHYLAFADLDEQNGAEGPKW